MKSLKSFILVPLIALVFGFAGGNLVGLGGPGPVGASDCPYESCVFDMGEDEYFCEASGQPNRCTLGLDTIMWSCDTCECGAVDCDEGGPLD